MENEQENEEIVLEPAENTAPEPLSAEEGIEDLRKKLEEQKLALEAEKTARERAERDAWEARSRAEKASSEVEDTNLSMLKAAISTVDRDLQIHKDNMKAAMAAADYDAVVDAQEQISLSMARKLQLENGLQSLESQIKAPKLSAINDPVEILASQLTPRSASWVREHPEYARNSALYRKMIAAHNLAVADGIQADTDDYFSTIEGILKIRKPEMVEIESPMSEASAPAQRRTAPPAAPVSRSAPGAARNTVRLSAEEREIASMMGMTDQEYATNKAALIKAGRLH
jgi:hypothetical protein